MTESEERAIKVITFSGNPKHWSVWEEKFMARAKRKGFKDLLLGKVDIPKTSDVLNAEEAGDKKKLRIKDLNELAFEELILSVEGDTKYGRVAFQLIKNCKSKDYEDGNAAQAWKRLSEKFSPKNAPDLLSLKYKFNSSKLVNKKKDPDIWLTDLEDMQAQLMNMGCNISDDELMMQVLNNLPYAYDIEVSMMQDRLGKEKDGLTIEEVRQSLNARYKKLQMRWKESNDYDSNSDMEDNEKAFAARQFKGRCRNCGKYGHKSSNCKEKKDNKGGRRSEGSKDEKFSKRFNGKCYNCNKFGHRASDCYLKKKSDNEQESDKAELVLMAKDNKTMDENIWIGDTGATCHMTNDCKGMTDVKEIKTSIVIGNGKELTATKVGTLKLKVLQKEGEDFEIILTNVKYVPELCSKLFSIGTAIKKGCELSSKGLDISLTKGKMKLVFDQYLHNGGGFVSGVKMQQLKEEAMLSVNKEKKVDIKVVHNVLGHVPEEVIKSTADYYNWKVEGQLDKCEDCAMGKIRQKNIKSGSDGKNVKQKKGYSPGECLSFDISSVKVQSLSKSKYWLLVIDEKTDMCWSFFLKQKSDLPHVMIEHINELKSKYKKEVKFLRCDNAGENKELEKKCYEGNLGIEFKFTAPNTPQQNGKVER
jgi:hypothetical protein